MFIKRSKITDPLVVIKDEDIVLSDEETRQLQKAAKEKAKQEIVEKESN